jgi:hypothetical protein
MAEFELKLDFTSFYKKTTLLQANGKVFFGLWNPPNIVLDGDEERVRVSERDRGRLDLIADDAYGDREYAPAILIANKLFYVPEDVVPGRVLIIPKMSRINEALQETTSGR